MEKIYYSIIIPHKNIPQLLKRCIDSIPLRNDLEIIVIDDNSNEEIVSQDDFPGLKRKNTIVIFSKEGKGAGYCRNIGLSKAKGKWIIFADADDFFTEEFNLILNEYKESNVDIIYFNASCVNSDTLQIAHRNMALNNFFKIRDISNFKYSCYAPWGKIIKRELQVKNNIYFSETMAANDVIFSIKIGHSASDIILDERSGYCVTVRDNSLERIHSTKVINDRIKISLEANVFFKTHKINKECDFFYRFLLLLLSKANFKSFIVNLNLCHSYGYSYIYLFKKMYKRIIYNIINKNTNIYK